MPRRAVRIKRKNEKDLQDFFSSVPAKKAGTVTPELSPADERGGKEEKSTCGKLPVFVC